MLTLYSKTNCPACISAAALLDKYTVPYNTIKIDENDEAKDFILARGFRTVPQIFRGNDLFIQGGYLGLVKMSEVQIKNLMYGEGT